MTLFCKVLSVIVYSPALLMRERSAVFYRASLITEQVLPISGEIVVRTESRVDDENQCAAAQKRYGLVPVGTGQYQAAMTAAATPWRRMKSSSM